MWLFFIKNFFNIILWTIMKDYECSWNTMKAYECSWLVHEHLRTFTNIHEASWTFIVFHESSFRVKRTFMNIHERNVHEHSRMIHERARTFMEPSCKRVVLYLWKKIISGFGVLQIMLLRTFLYMSFYVYLCTFLLVKWWFIEC